MRSFNLKKLPLPNLCDNPHLFTTFVPIENATT